MDTEPIARSIYRLGGRFVKTTQEGAVRLTRAGFEEISRRIAQAVAREGQRMTTGGLAQEIAKEAARIRAAAARTAKIDSLALRAAALAMHRSYAALLRYAKANTPEEMEEALLFFDHAYESLSRFRPRLAGFAGADFDDDAAQYGTGREADKAHFEAWLGR